MNELKREFVQFKSLRAVGMLLWFLCLAGAMACFEVPSGLPWYQVVGGGFFFGLGNYIYTKIA